MPVSLPPSCSPSLIVKAESSLLPLTAFEPTADLSEEFSDRQQPLPNGRSVGRPEVVHNFVSVAVLHTSCRNY